MAKWTNEEIQELIDKRDKDGTIDIVRRVPKNVISTKNFAIEVARESGFYQKDIIKVIDIMSKVLIRNLYDGKAVRINRIATFYTYIVEGYIKKCLVGKKKYGTKYIQPRYKLKVKPNIAFREALDKKEVTKEEAYKMFDRSNYNKRRDER